MSFHIKIGGVSLCKCDIPHEDRLLAMTNHIQMACEPIDKEAALETAEFLWALGYPVEIVEGHCDQRDDEYFED
jgi:hypothetical protein